MRKQAVVSGILTIANGMSLSCVGEGVETSGQLAWLADRGRHSLQIFVVCKPVPAGELLESLGSASIIAKAA